jgi:hypothetical protein
MSHRTLRLTAAVLLAMIVGAFMQAILDLPYRIRLTPSVANYWAVAAGAALVPPLLLLLLPALPKAWLRRIGIIATAILALPCLLISSCAMLEAPSLPEPDTSYELLSEAREDAVAYRLYRTNCGATCAFGLDLREERDLLFGVKLVSPKWSLYRASEGAVRLEQSSVLIVRGEEILGRVAR